MDDSLEFPNAIPQKPTATDTAFEENEEPSDEEEGGLDWMKLLPSAARPVIPKRGEKEFEPRAGGESNLQLHVLDRSRAAMFETLRAERRTSNKAISYAIWHPTLARAEVTLARGIHFSSMGHSALRSTIGGGDGVEKPHKRLELLPEEAIYLIERGSLFCWKKTDLDIISVPELEDVLGVPMTVQQAYSEMIGREDLTLERFQVFAYLKRLGYVITRTNPPNSHYLTAPRLVVNTAVKPILQRIASIFSLWGSWLSRVFGLSSWWYPVRISRFFHHDKSYRSLFRSMRFMPAGHSVPLHSSPNRQKDDKSSPYQIFYNLYKPSTPFKKTAPPPPDFQIVVINARTTSMPTLQELTDLFDVLPEIPLPLPHRRRPVPGSAPNINSRPLVEPPHAAVEQPSSLRRLFPWAFPAKPPAQASRKPNPFMALKSGKKVIVIAVVDAGSLSFFRFGQGAFTDWPMI